MLRANVLVGIGNAAVSARAMDEEELEEEPNGGQEDEDADSCKPTYEVQSGPFYD